MRIIELSGASRPIAEYAEAVNDEIIVFTSKTKPVAALVSLKHTDRESLALSLSPEFMTVIEAAREEFKAGQKYSLEEMKRQLLATGS